MPRRRSTAPRCRRPTIIRGRLARRGAQAALHRAGGQLDGQPAVLRPAGLPGSAGGCTAHPPGLPRQPDGAGTQAGGAGDIVLRPMRRYSLRLRAGTGGEAHLSGAVSGGPHRSFHHAHGAGCLPAFPQAERTLQTATVSSLRLDAVLAAMLRCSRGAAAELVTAGRVEINHLPAESVHAPVYEGMSSPCGARAASG